MRTKTTVRGVPIPESEMAGAQIRDAFEAIYSRAINSCIRRARFECLTRIITKSCSTNLKWTVVNDFF